MRGSPSPLLRTGPKEMDACTVGNQDNRLRERKEEGKKKMEKKEHCSYFFEKVGKGAERTEETLVRKLLYL